MRLISDADTRRAPGAAGWSGNSLGVYNVCVGMSAANPYVVSVCLELSNLHTGTRSDGAGASKRAKTEGPRVLERDAEVSTVAVEGLGTPTGLFVCGDGTIVACAGHCVRTFKPGGPGIGLKASILAGLDMANAFRDAVGDEARFGDLQGITGDENHNFLVIDSGKGAVRRVYENGSVQTLAAGRKDSVDETGNAARFVSLNGVATTLTGAYLITDFGNHAVLFCTSDGAVRRLAGDGSQGFVDGNGTRARFDGPAGLARDRDGSFLVADWGNNAIRRVAINGTVSTVAGNGEPGYADGKGGAARFRGPCAVVVDESGAILVADSGNNCIRMIRGRDVTTLAGGPEEGEVDGDGESARFNSPYRLALDERGCLLVAETRAVDKLRKVCFSATTRARFRMDMQGSRAF